MNVIFYQKVIKTLYLIPDGGLLQFYISCKWFCKFKTFAEPGMIHNQDFLCPHGGVQPLKIERLEEVCLPVSAVVWEALHTRYYIHS